VRTDIQRRSTTTELELRGAAGSGAVLAGHAAVFDRETVVSNLFREKVGRSAFRKTLADGADVRCLLDHVPSQLLGRTRARTLTLEEDDIGLAFAVRLPDTQLAHDTLALVERGDLSECSFAFSIIREDRQEPVEGESLPLFTLREVRLFDVSLVAYPQYDGTDVAVAHIDQDVRLAAARFADFIGKPVDEVLAAIRRGETQRLWSPSQMWTKLRDTLSIS
jgi:HK97 family phage prohead protease